MSIPIEQSITGMTDRMREVMDARLVDKLAGTETADYPLPVPGRWIVGDEDMEQAAKRLGSPSVYGAIIYSPSELASRASGDGSAETYRQTTQTSIYIVAKAPAGAPLPTRHGHQVSRERWMGLRAEMYRGALQYVAARYLPDGDVIQQVALERSGISPPIDLEVGAYRSASAVIEVTQTVIVPTAQYEED